MYAYKEIMSTSIENHPILTVSQFTNAIKMSLESTFPTVWLQGEVSNCKLQTSGHLYFSLKDANAQIAVVMFRGDLANVARVPKDGDHLVVRGEMNVYPPSGKYQLLAREMRHAGVGELLLKLEELKIKLHKKGWFSPARKKNLPKFPQRIGIVTSPTGAVIQDIINVLSRRFSGFQLILNPVRVQGEGAAKEIAEAIAQFNQFNLVDVIIVGRGGGSIEDLWAFNEEIVAEAIFNSRIPIISAVGHETDHCIADYVADVRAPTPSAAAEIVIAEKKQMLNHLLQTQNRLQQNVQHLLKNYSNRFKSICKNHFLTSPYAILGAPLQKIDDLRCDVDQSMLQLISQKKLLLNARKLQLSALKPHAQISHFRQKLNQWDRALLQALTSRIENSKKHLAQRQVNLLFSLRVKQESCTRQFISSMKLIQLNQIWNRLLLQRQEKLKQICHTLHALDPKNVLTKGYCILFSEKDHSVITSVHQVEKNQDMRMLLMDGELISTVKSILAK